MMPSACPPPTPEAHPDPTSADIIKSRMQHVESIDYNLLILALLENIESDVNSPLLVLSPVSPSRAASNF
jgi:hypothetical protein